MCLDDAEQILDEMMFVSYRTQRELGCSAESLEKAGFAGARELEKKFQLYRVNTFMANFYANQSA
jgi:hypothetical protein